MFNQGHMELYLKQKTVFNWILFVYFFMEYILNINQLKKKGETQEIVALKRVRLDDEDDVISF